MAFPVADYYGCASGGVIAGGRFSFFSDQGEVGSYNSGTYVWTPGRDANGVISRASWDLIPVDTWVSVSDTAFTTKVQPLLTAALPSYNDPGSTDLAAVLDAYNGFAYDVSGGRVFAHGGGHQNSANNGLYRLDLKKMSWVIAKLPDMQTDWPSNYKTNPPRDNSYTIYTSAKDYGVANPSTTETFYDKFFDTANPAADTRNPTSRHTYCALTFYGGKLRHGVRSYWEWSEATGEWSNKYPLGKNYSTHTITGGGYCGEAVKGTFDEVNNRYICTPTQISSVPSPGWAYNAATDTFNNPSNLLNGWEGYAAVFARRGREWCSFARPTLTDFFPATMKVWNLDTEARTTVTLSGLMQSKCISGAKFDESTIMDYCTIKGKFFVALPYDLNDVYGDVDLPLECFWIDTDAGTITHESQSGAWPSLTSTSLVKNKLFYIPQIAALCMVANATSSVLLRKLA